MLGRCLIHYTRNINKTKQNKQSNTKHGHAQTRNTVRVTSAGLENGIFAAVILLSTTTFFVEVNILKKINKRNVTSRSLTLITIFKTSVSHCQIHKYCMSPFIFGDT